MADLRKRLLAGDLTALTDPALELELLTGPTADWWRQSVQVCLCGVYVRLAHWFTTTNTPLPPPGASQSTGAYLMALFDLAAPLPNVADALRVLLRYGAAYVEGAVPDVDDAREVEVMRRMLVAQGFDGVSVRVSRLHGSHGFVAVWQGYEQGMEVAQDVWETSMMTPRGLVRELAERFGRGFARLRKETMRL